ncbi:unnamed protein product [Clonostachys rosea]|uniref:Uncharacterized protein n=1 Tax=Bionectria ochroleuca TaxID=29856 RepID=A0ABY6U8T3_BIOOC|nr:unnamed protein product [Clonostachys rosea]
MTQAELEGFVNGLGPNLEEIILHDFSMVGRTWVPALDILREKVAGRKKGTRGFHFAHLKGNDIRSFVESDDELLAQYFDQNNQSTAMRIIERYVNDNGITENPLRNYIDIEPAS